MDDKSTKFSFNKLSKSSTYYDLIYASSSHGNTLFLEKRIIDNKKYLLTLSKFVDFKINSSKQTFRSKDNFILIEQVAYLCSQSILNNDCTKVYAQYSKLSKYFQLRQKEDRVFKFLLAKNFFKLICEFKSELFEIDKVIKKSKTTTKLHNYKKQILNSAEVYSIKKFNPNATKLLINTKNQQKLIDDFLGELVFIDRRIEAMLSYLTVIFS